MIELVLCGALALVVGVLILRAAVLAFWPDSRAGAFVEVELAFLDDVSGCGDGDAGDSGDGGGD